MKPAAADIAEAVARFGFRKTANLGSIVPQVAGPALGAFLGRRFLGPHLGKNMGDELGTLIGGVTGGVGGRVLGDSLGDAPADAGYAMDPTMQDIPAWARTGAQLLQPSLKTSAHDEGVRDMLLGEIPGYAPIQGAREQGWKGAIKGTLGQVAGGVGGGALGLGAGALVNKLVGHDVTIPGINMPLSHVMAGLGGTLGATKGFQAALGR